MKHKSFMFDFQKCIDKIRKRAEDQTKKGIPMLCEPLLKTITGDTELEDLPLYKQYLSRFDVEHDLADIDMKVFPPFFKRLFYSDYLVFVRFVVASQASITYEFEYDVNDKDVELIVTLDYCGQTHTTRCSDLGSYDFRGCFVTFLEEQLNLQYLYEVSETLDGEGERNRKVKEYRRKVKNLHEQRERMLSDQKDSENTLSELDDLLGECP